MEYIRTKQGIFKSVMFIHNCYRIKTNSRYLDINQSEVIAKSDNLKKLVDGYICTNADRLYSTKSFEEAVLWSKTNDYYGYILTEQSYIKHIILCVKIVKGELKLCQSKN